MNFPRSASNTLTLGSSVVKTVNPTSISTANIVTFGQVLDLPGETIQVAASNTVIFDDATWLTDLVTSQSAITYVKFRNSVREVINAEVFPPIIVSASNTISFNIITEAINASDPLILEAENLLSFVNIVTKTIDPIVSTSNILIFTQGAIGVKDEDVYHSRIPISPVLGSRSRIRLDDGTTQIDLHKPIFGNSEEINVIRTINQMRGGEINMFRDPNWPIQINLKYSIEIINQTDMVLLDAFILTNLGKTFTLIDHENRSWTVIILNPQEPAARKRDDNCGQWTRNLDFVGSLI